MRTVAEIREYSFQKLDAAEKEKAAKTADLIAQLEQSLSALEKL